MLTSLILPAETHAIRHGAGSRKRISKRKYLLSFLSFLLILSLVSCQFGPRSQDAAFREFTGRLFRQEVASNTISLHYTLRHPETYGLADAPVTYGGFSTDQAAAMASVENCLAALHKFDAGALSADNRLTYEVLESYLKTASDGARFLLYQEPLSPITGLHAQLPVLLSEFPLHSASDVDAYLELLAQTGAYFDSLLLFEQAKARQGLFMPDYQVDAVTAQCRSFVAMDEGNYLLTTFPERLEPIDGLSAETIAEYCARNAEQVQSVIFPAYTRLADALESLKGSGSNDKGLFYLPKGREYYAYVVRQSAGISQGIPALQAMTKAQIQEDFADMEAALYSAGTATGRAVDTAPTVLQADGSPILTAPSLRRNVAIPVDSSLVLESAAPTSILDDLKEQIRSAFPEIPQVDTVVKYVPAAMEDYLSPAFYMIPAIDNTEENVIYINQGQTAAGLNLFTTLAHEGYPGHLYQTVYYAGRGADPIRSVLNFGGYVEGWATYAEMLSYYLAPLPKNEAALLQKNSSIMLGLYALADMGIHYDGWSLADAASFFREYGITDSDVVRRIYELIVGDPGNYLKYYLGYLKFLHLKEDMAKELGDRFSQKEFHRAVLDVGPAPFDIVEDYVRQTLTN